MKTKNALMLLLAVLSCACSQVKTGQNGTSLLPIDSFEDQRFKDYASWAIFLHGLHGVYGEEGFFAIYPKSKQRFAGEWYTALKDENDKLATSELYYFWFQDRETKSEIDLNVDGIKATKLNMNFYLTEKGEQPPTIQIDETGDGAYQVTFTLDGEIIGEGTIEHVIQIISVDDVRDYLSENLLFI